MGTPEAERRARFEERANAICKRHAAQTVASVEELRNRYQKPILGEVSPWTLLEKLAQCIDPTDLGLYCTSQQLHVLQILEAMEADGVQDRDLYLAALIHDVGKVLLLSGEAPENVVCFNEPIGKYRGGVGLDNCVMQWNHDELAYTRLKDHVPDHVAWLVRYHSIRRGACEPYLDRRDRAYADRYLRVFARYDQGTKSPHVLPKKRITDYRGIVESMLPPTLVF
jgi:predicted HD phosphohydrolase